MLVNYTLRADCAQKENYLQKADAANQNMPTERSRQPLKRPMSGSSTPQPCCSHSTRRQRWDRPGSSLGARGSGAG